MMTHKDNYCQTGSSLYDLSEDRYWVNSDDDDQRHYYDPDHDVFEASEISSLQYQLDDKVDQSQNVAAKMGIVDSMPQVFAALIANLLPMQAGINMGYSSILIPQLSDPLADIPISKDEASWIASLVTISLPIGSLIIGPLIDKFGRKRIAMLATIPFLIGWILMATAQNLTMIYLARILCGIGAGLSTLSVVYVSEISDPHIRPALLCLNSVYVSLGILLTSALGMFFEWRFIAVMFVGITLASSLLLLFIPESPHWLITFRPKEELSLIRSMKWIYRREPLFNTRVDQLILLNEQQHRPPAKHHYSYDDEVCQARTGHIQPWFRTYMQPQVYKPLIILLVIFLFQQLSGAYVIIFYAVHLFLKIGGHFGEGINEYGALLMLAVIRFLMSIVASLLSQKVGRRKLMFLSGLGMAVCTIVAGLYMYYEELLEDYYAHTETKTDDIDPDSKENDVVLLICVLAYVMFCALGFMVIPWILIGELLPTKVKGTLGGIVVTLAYIMMFGAVKSFPYVIDWLGTQGVFYIFSTTSFLGVVYTFIYLPETLGKSFDEIERYFGS